MILIVDDDIAVQTSLSLLLKQNGYKTNVASNPDEALPILNKQKPETIILDMNFGNETSGDDGIAFLQEVKKIYTDVPVILITAWGSISLAVEGMKLGAFDFVSKPWENNHLLNTIQLALNINADKANKSTLKRKDLDQKFNFEGLIGESPQITSILETIGRIGRTDAPVLILGESGTGKELIAEAIHNNSNREKGPFVKVNLGGISSSLFESEMFGHKKGAFTDAYNDRQGRFALADKGTIFLDEIGDLDFNSQVKLLRVLQDKTYQVLGESTTRKTDVRVVCATNRNLKEMVQQGTFREDLFYRINLITLQLPPLRERQDDTKLLVNFFLNNLKELYDADTVKVDSKTLNWIAALPLQGNIRELKNMVERTWLMSGKSQLEISDFKNALEQPINKPSGEGIPEPGSITLDELEKEMIIKALNKYQGNISQIAKSLGLSRGALYRRLEKYDIPYNKET